MEKFHIAGDAESLDAAATSHRNMAHLVAAAAREVEATPLEDWTGEAAEAARAKRRKLADAMHQAERAMTTIADGHAELAQKIRSTREKIADLAVAALAATAVGLVLTWATAGLMASVTAYVDEAIVATIGATILGLEAETLATVGTWLTFNGVVGLIEGITFTGVDHQLEGTEWTPDDAAQVFTIAGGSLLGRGVSVGAGALIEGTLGTAETAAARVGQGALAGAIGGATAGTANPILVPLARGDRIDWGVVGGSAGINFVLGGLGGAAVGAGNIGPTTGRFNNLSNAIRTVAARPNTGGAGEIEMVPTTTVPGGGTGDSGSVAATYGGSSGDSASLSFSGDSDGEGTFWSDSTFGSSDGSDSGWPDDLSEVSTFGPSDGSDLGWPDDLSEISTFGSSEGSGQGWPDDLSGASTFGSSAGSTFGSSTGSSSGGGAASVQTA
jgi:hypothetical protein